MEYFDTVGILKAVAAKKEGAYVLVSREKEGDSWTVTDLQGNGSNAGVEARLKLAVRLEDDVQVPVEDPIALDDDIAEMGDDDLLVVEEVDDAEVRAVESEVKDQAELDAENDIDLLISQMPQLSVKGSLGGPSVDGLIDISLQDIPPIHLDKFVSALAMGIDTQATGIDTDVTNIGDEEVWRDNEVEEQGSDSDDDRSDSERSPKYQSKYFTPHKPNPHRIVSTKNIRVDSLFTIASGDDGWDLAHSKGNGNEQEGGEDVGEIGHEPKIQCLRFEGTETDSDSGFSGDTPIPAGASLFTPNPKTERQRGPIKSLPLFELSPEPQLAGSDCNEDEEMGGSQSDEEMKGPDSEDEGRNGGDDSEGEVGDDESMAGASGDDESESSDESPLRHRGQGQKRPRESDDSPKQPRRGRRLRVEAATPSSAESSPKAPRRSNRLGKAAAIPRVDEAEDDEVVKDWPVEQTVFEVNHESVQNLVFRETATSEPSKLLKTSFMDLHGICYNVSANVIICPTCPDPQGGPTYGGGVPFDHLVGHLKRHGLPPKESERKFYVSILKDLSLAVGEVVSPIATMQTYLLTAPKDLPREEVKENWRATVRPLGGSREPIEGVKILSPGYCCNLPPCSSHTYPFSSRYLATVQHHQYNRDSQHTVDFSTILLKDRYIVVPGVQTIFDTSKGVQVYFPVNVRSGSVPRPLASAATSGDDILNAFALEADEVLGEVGELTGHSALIPPAFVEMGMNTLWDAVDMADVRKFNGIRPVKKDNANKRTVMLMNATLSVFMAIAESALNAHEGILHLVTSGARNSGYASNKPFHIPQQTETLAKYCSHEILFLRRMIYVAKNPLVKTKGKDAGTPVFQFDAQQTKNIDDLTKQLNNKSASLSSIANLVVSTLHSFYFPTNPEDAAFDRFSQPLIAYFAITCLTREGSPIPLAHVPVRIAPMQFAMRLHGYHHIYTLYQLSRSSSLLSTTESCERQAADARAKHQLSSSKGLLESGPPAIPAISGEGPERRSGRLAGKTAARVASKTRSQPPTSSRRVRAVGVGDDEEYVDRGEESSSDAGSTTAAAKFDINATARKHEESGTVIEAPKQAVWFIGGVKFVAVFLTEGKVSPYSALRHGMHVFSCAQRNSKKIPFVRWRDEFTVLINNDAFVLSEFVVFMDYQLGELEKFIRKGILYDVSLDDLGIPCDFTYLEDTGDVTTVGYGPLLAGTKHLNPDAEKLLVHLCRKGDLVSVQGGQVKWKTKEAIIWTKKMSLALGRLAMLCHILQGAPGRGSEEVLMQIANTTAGRRHLFVERAAGVLLFFSNYWKGAHNAGRFNEVIRVLPYRPARLLFTLIRVVRPVELLFLGKSMDDDAKRLAKKAYATSLWASDGGYPAQDFLQRLAPAFFDLPGEDGISTFHWITGLRMWRHTVVAVQRHKFPDSKFTKAVATEGTSIADAQAGRSGAVSNQYYATLHSTTPADANLLNHYIFFSRAWHSFFGQSTTFEPGRTYVV